MLTLLYANVSSGTCALRMHTCVQKTPLTHTHLCPRHGTIKGLEDNKLLGLIFVVYLRVLGDNAWRSGGRALRTWEHLLLLPCCVGASPCMPTVCKHMSNTHADVRAEASPTPPSQLTTARSLQAARSKLKKYCNPGDSSHVLLLRRYIS